MTFAIRALEPGDREAWEPLWQGYLRFYEVALPAAQTDLTWSRFLDDEEPMGALGAFADGNLVGICHHLFHRSTWGDAHDCYLEDLFVSPDSRRGGVGRALIEATADVARAAGSWKVYWHTRNDNVRARALYDQVGTDEGFIVYERLLRS
jgi:GNAT superfamily N-acetyltransferase